jgi:hypothetical protein
MDEQQRNTSIHSSLRGTVMVLGRTLLVQREPSQCYGARLVGSATRTQKEVLRRRNRSNGQTDHGLEYSWVSEGGVCSLGYFVLEFT